MGEEKPNVDDAGEIEKVDEIETEASSEDVAADDGIDPEQGIEELKRSLAESKKAAEEAMRARAEAERRAYQLGLENQKNAQEAQSARLDHFNSALSQLEERETALITALTDAKSMGDYSKEVEIQKAYLENMNALQRIKQGRDALEYQLRQPVQRMAPPPASTIETWVESLTPRTGAWLRKNAAFFERNLDQTKELAKAAHVKATALGYVSESDAYFDFVEKELGMKKPSRRVVEEEDDADDDEAFSAAAKPKRSVSPPAAPVSRGGDRKGTIHLSAAEKEAAEISGLSYEEYYRNMQKEKKRAR